MSKPKDMDTSGDDSAPMDPLVPAVEPPSRAANWIRHDVNTLERQRVYWMFGMAKRLNLTVTVKHVGCKYQGRPYNAEQPHMTLDTQQWPNALLEVHTGLSRKRVWILKNDGEDRGDNHAMWINNAGHMYGGMSGCTPHGVYLGWEKWRCTSCISDLQDRIEYSDATRDLLREIVCLPPPIWDIVARYSECAEPLGTPIRSPLTGAPPSALARLLYPV